MVDEYRRRRNFIAAAFKDMGIECHRPLGAFYAFPAWRIRLKSKDFALKLLNEEKVAAVPGTAWMRRRLHPLRLRDQHGKSQGSDGAA